jgi:hypothetical protein
MTEKMFAAARVMRPRFSRDLTLVTAAIACVGVASAQMASPVAAAAQVASSDAQKAEITGHYDSTVAARTRPRRARCVANDSAT